jgi:sortase (surface protein transpeptidase)
VGGAGAVPKLMTLTGRMMRRGLFVTALSTLLVAGLCGCSTTSSAPEPPPAVQTDNNASPGSLADPMERSTPVRLRIPAIAVDAVLMDLGLHGDGTMEVPPDGIRAGWYTGAPTPGERGPAVIAGHVDWGGHPAVFNRLHTLGPDDQIIVTREDGTAATFRVTRLEQFPKNAFASEKVYGNIDHAGLRLITCGGSFDPQLHSYEDNVVVFAELVDGQPSGEAR